MVIIYSSVDNYCLALPIYAHDRDRLVPLSMGNREYMSDLLSLSVVEPNPDSVGTLLQVREKQLVTIGTPGNATGHNAAHPQRDCKEGDARPIPSVLYHGLHPYSTTLNLETAVARFAYYATY